MNAHEFAVGPEGLRYFSKRMVPYLAFMLGLIAALVFGLQMVQGRASDQTTSGWPIHALFLAILLFGGYRRYKRQMDLLRGYRLRIDDERITREQAHHVPIIIERSAVRLIKRGRNGSYAIFGQGTAVIPVHSGMERQAELDAVLEALGPIELASKKNYALLLIVVGSIGLIACMGVVMASDNKWLVGLCGLIVSSVLIWSLIGTRRSPHVDERIKKRMWWVLLPLFGVLANMFAKLMM